jgi:hypothetical protein
MHEFTFNRAIRKKRENSGRATEKKIQRKEKIMVPPPVKKRKKKIKGENLREEKNYFKGWKTETPSILTET